MSADCLNGTPSEKWAGHFIKYWLWRLEWLFVVQFFGHILRLMTRLDRLRDFLYLRRAQFDPE